MKNMPKLSGFKTGDQFRDEWRYGD